jgi:hypothetical protein
MTMSEIALAVAARTAASVEIGIGKALGDRQMIETGKAQRRRADAQYAQAVERGASDRSDFAC